MADHCDREDCACNSDEYMDWLMEASAWVALPPANVEEMNEVSRLARDLGFYCNDHGLGEPSELYELRALLLSK